MRVSDMFESKYLKETDLKGQDRTVTIGGVFIEDVGTEEKPEHKPVLYFQGIKKGLILNKTNAQQIAHIYGDDSDGWIGKQIVLFSMMVTYKGQTVPGIRVRGAGTPSPDNTFGDSPVNVGGTMASPPSDPAAPGGPLPPAVEGDEIPW